MENEISLASLPEGVTSCHPDSFRDLLPSVSGVLFTSSRKKKKKKNFQMFTRVPSFSPVFRRNC
jgi:steroid 5-alpha reductase family enzyme